MLTDKQDRFCKEYIIDCNATQAYIRAGYCPRRANASAARLLANDSIRVRIDELMAEKDDELIAKGDEVLKYLTSVMRGETEAEVVVVEGTGDGCSDARCIKKAPDERERLKAAELIGKRYGLFTERVEVDSAMPVTIINNIPRPQGAESDELTAAG